jgi:hypothetical protein
MFSIMQTSKLIPFLLIVSMLIIPDVYAQSLIPRKCYLRLTASVNREIPMEVNLVKNNDTVFGECTFPGKTDGLGNIRYSGNPLPVSGKVSNDGSFLITMNSGGIPINLKGNFTSDQKLKGIYEAEGASGNMTFELTESYPPGSLTLNAFFLKGSVALVKKKNSPLGKIQLSMLLPGESANSVLSDSLKRLVIKRYTDREVSTTDPEKILNAIAQIYYDTYVSANLDIYDKTSGQSFNWELLNYMHVVQNGSHVLTFYDEQYAFTGGANGLQTRRYTNVSLNTGKPIQPEELFRGDNKEKLSRLLTMKAREQYQIPSNKTLTEAGFFIDEIVPNANFYITRNGIGFYFNQYDIAPRSNGTSDLFFRFEELMDFLVTDGILKEFLK